MRVLHCIAQLPDATGSGIYFRSLFDGLYNKSHQNGLVFACQGDRQYNFENADYQYSVQFNIEALPFNVAGMSDIMPYDSTVYSSMSDNQIKLWIKAFTDALIHAKTQFNPDIVICHHLFILASIVRELFCNKPVYIVCHGTDIRQWLQHKDFCGKHITHTNDFQGYFTLSCADKATLHSLFNIDLSLIHVTGGAYNAKVFYPDNHHKSNRIKLFYCGKISESKGVFELASAFGQIKDKYNIELMFCGNASNEHRAKLMQLSGNSDRVTIFHALNQVEMAKLMRSYDIFILPSYYEGLGLVALEALASGLMLVSARHSGLYELLGNSINSSGVVEYVDLPRLYDIDKPLEEDKPQYVTRLAYAIERQISKLNMDYTFIKDDIESLSWQGLCNKIAHIMNI